MNDMGYNLAEKEAAKYFKFLYEQANEKTYVCKLTDDIERWKKYHSRSNSVFSLIFRNKIKDTSDGYKSYIEWLQRSGKLDNYLERSISYIYLRDLGKPLDSLDTQKSIRKTVDSLKKHITKSNELGIEQGNAMVKLYRKAQDIGVESTVIWLINKLRNVFTNIPRGIDSEQAKRKLIKIIIGVVMHQVEELEEDISHEELSNKIKDAIVLGYCYGLTYPFIDDILDSDILSIKEKEQYSDLIRDALITREVKEIDNWDGENIELVRYIHLELREAFKYIKEYQSEETIESFFQQAYIFFKAQEVDRLKNLSYPKYSNEDIYIPIILKSYSSRLIVRSVIGASEDKGFESRTFFYGIYNQLADDFTDMFEDMKSNSVTPYTYYMKYRDVRKDLLNPFELYWTVIYNLIHNVYKSDFKTCEVILCRAINSLNRFKEKIGKEKYNEVMDFLSLSNSSFNTLIQKLVNNSQDVEFFDKLLRDNINDILKSEEKEKNDFVDTIKIMQKEIDSILKISNFEISSIVGNKIITAANYSIGGNGKRIRPIISWNIGVNAYGLNKDSMVPLIRSLEYMHTGSLIFDDLPSQDNADIRRGHETLHKVYNVAIAELTGILLIQKATEEQTHLDEFDSNLVIELIRYSAKAVERMCIGQAIDLESRENKLNIEQLKEMCFYKTGLAFEAALVMPAILGKATKEELAALKKFAYYSGIAFQIKDDLLDEEGDSKLLGKIVGKDLKNNNSTFVTILGIEEAKKEMWEHYCKAIESLKEFKRDSTFLKHLMNYIINRDN